MFALIHTHRWSLTEIEGMLPWERDVYIALLTNLLEFKEMQAKQNRQNM